MDSTLTLHGKPPEAPAPSLAAHLPAGTVIAERFTLQTVVGSGGMGVVYLATDSLSGQPVALKLLHTDSAEALQRFSREASVLAGLRHPGIVSFVAHGATPEGRPFLAMEWLEGEDLAQRLARKPLSLQESLSLLRNASQALSLAHQQGVIHRDLKPSNLFLRHGRPEDLVLLDFGLARHLVPSQALTATQVVVGTPGYMAPEQVSAQPLLTASADLFSLGCVFYECLTGKRPFAAPHLVAVLAKILFAEPEPLRAVRPELPATLQELLERMLAKAPERRFPEASSLLAALASLQAQLEAAVLSVAPASTSLLQLAGAEQHLVSVLLAAPLLSSESEPLLGTEDSRRSLRDALRALLAPHGAQVEQLADGSLVATLASSYGAATDLAALGARCALFLQERWPQAAIVLTTGRGRLDQHGPVGEAMDRAGQLLRQLEPRASDSSAPVLLDEVTAGLLGSGFQLTRSQPGVFLLHGVQLGVDASRPLLGKPTPCVGREQELALLELAFTACVQEPVAQAVLVKAPAGTGKSRLRHEFLRRLERQSRPVLVLLGRGDPMSAGSAGGLLAQALRRLCGLSGAEPLKIRQERLSERLGQHLTGPQAQEELAFLGELCGISFSDDHHPRLRAARLEPQRMNTQMGRALVAFLRAECAHHTVLLVLEDLHWGDQLSIKLVDEALRKLSEQPFMVLALARSEVEQLFPNLWSHRLQEVPLRGLTRKAGARLVREVLGPEVSDTVIDRLAEQSEGNALFLEELIRAVAEGRGEAAPPTVLVMLQARLGRLEPHARQVLLAASLLGRSFWHGAVRALLGEVVSASEVEHWLQRLVAQEWLEQQPSSRFPSEVEYRFHHALVRDAAYGLVPDSHKPTGHQLAGQWLEQAGESDPQVLAEHARLGQQPERAIQFLLQAAEQFFERYDLPGALRCVEGALALGAQGAPLVRLRALQACAAYWMDDFAKLFELGDDMVAQLRPGSLEWCWLVTGLYVGHDFVGRYEQAARLRQQLLGAQPEEDARAALLEALWTVVSMCSWNGARQEAAECLLRMGELRAQAAPGSSLEHTWFLTAQGYFSFTFEARPWQLRVWAEQAHRRMVELGVEKIIIFAHLHWGEVLEALGDRVGAELQCREGLALAQQAGQPLTYVYARLLLGVVLASSRDPAQQEEAVALASAPGVEKHNLFSGLAHLVRARVAASRGELAEAEAQARTACGLHVRFLSYQNRARIVLSGVLLAQGRAAGSRQEAALGVQRLDESDAQGASAVGLRLALAEACLAEGDSQAGEAALRGALHCLRSGAQDIPDEAARQRFLLQVPENARTLELARQRWGEDAVSH